MKPNARRGPDDVARARALHLLHRTTFGPRLGDPESLLDEGFECFLDRQLAAEDPDDSVTLRLEATPRIHWTIPDVVKRHQALNGSRVPIEETLDDMRSAKVIRAVHSENQLLEVMVDFWYNHFNVYAYAWEPSVPAYEKNAIRPHAFGRFRDLLHAVAHDSAMLFFLDGYLNVADRVADGKEIKGLNENYGRELLELHTVGVNAGYDQSDVTDAARAFTGWALEGWGTPDPSYRYTFLPEKHDSGRKRVFGLQIEAGGGASDGERILDYLAGHPKTAHFISNRLVQKFVADDPPRSLVDRCATTFRRTGGDIREVLRTIFRSDEFWSPAHAGARFKRPLEFVAGSLRATGSELTNGRGCASALAKMGMPLYECKPPTGYSNAGADWINPSSQIHKFDFAFKLTSGRIDGVELDWSAWDSQADALAVANRFDREILCRPIGPATRGALHRLSPDSEIAPVARMAGVLLVSPEFQVH